MRNDRVEGLASSLRAGWQLPLTIAALGILFRLVWVMVKMPGHYATGEVAHVAVAFARTGILADPFQPGQGPTAHVMPIPPIYAGLIYRLLGIRTAPAEFVLAAIASTLVVGSLLFLFVIFGYAGMPRRTRLIALTFGCLAPVNFLLEAVEFRIWEGALATFTAFGFIAAMLTIGQREQVGWGRLTLLTALAALVFFISPPLGLGCYLCALLWCRDRFQPRQMAAIAGIAAATLVLTLAPWTLRNRAVLHHDIVLRSNAGLELAIGNYPGEFEARDPAAAFRHRLAAIHPMVSERAFKAMQAAGGEIDYAKQLGAQATAWIAAHPAEFLTLYLWHGVQFLFPPAWFWNIYLDHGTDIYAKAFIEWLVSFAALLGLGLAMAEAPGRYREIAILFVTTVAVYAAVQPVPRYGYLIWGMSIYLAAHAVASVSLWLVAQRRADELDFGAVLRPGALLRASRRGER